MTSASSTSFAYWMPTRIVFGEGSLSRLPELIGNPQARVLVVGTSSMGRLGVLDQIRDLLGTERTAIFDRARPNPTPELVDEVVTVFRDEGCNAVAGIGGGSAMDMAKSVAILQANPHNTRAYLSNEAILENRGAPYVAIPTTAGTGSEVTPWATIWDAKAHRKYSLEHRWMFPTAAIVDPTLTASLPPRQTAIAGMDALTQAIEAYWSRNSQHISDVLALAAVEKIRANLEAACHDNNPRGRTAMAQGSLLSGLAFSNTKTTICHSLSYPMTAHFGVPHGQAVSITLASFLMWNSEAIEAKLHPLLRVLGAESVQEAADHIRVLMASVGLATHLRSLGLSRKDIDLVSDEGFYADRASHNPRPVGVEDVRSILLSVY